MVMAMASARFLAVFPLLLHSRSSASHQLLRRLATRHSPHLFLSPPIALLPLRPSRHSSLHPIPLKFAETLHPFQECQSGSGSSRVLDSWPEWSEFVNWVSTSGYCGNGSFDDAQFVQDLSPDFVRAANGCLHFARNHPNLLWSLPREDVEVVVESCSQFLFKDAFGTTRRMKAFLGIGPSDVLESDKPTTVDLMRFLLSYAHMAVISSENKLINSAVESSVRKLLSELVNLRSIYTDSNTSIQSQFPERYGQASRPFRKTIEMKRGDWTCPRCSFMNFAMNLKCRECEEPQPHKYLTGREWECPQCNFFNFGRNAICLRCDCNKPVLGVTEDGMGKITPLKESSNARLSAKDETGNNSFSFETTKWGVDTNDDGTDPKTTDANMEITEYLDEVLDQKSTSDMNNIHAGLTESENPSQVKNMETEEAGKSQRWINKVAEIYDVKDQSTPICNKDFPEIMPIRKGENRFVVSKKKDRSLTSPIYKRRMAMENHTSDNKNVPFVPFPPGYFASPNDKSQESSNRRLSSPDNNNSDTPSTPNQQSDDLTTMKSGTKDKVKTQNSSNFQTNSSWLSESQSSWMGRSLEGSAVTEHDPLDMSEEAKAERWFRRVAQIKDMSELSQIPDEDFPSIMPMRKGVNRFVVSKRKTPLERRLTSSQYRRNLPSVNLDLEKKETDSG